MELTPNKAIFLATLFLTGFIGTENSFASNDWTQKKCTFYAQAFDQILAEVGPKGLSERFIAENRAFIKAGCSNGTDICPVSDEEFEVANRLSIAAVNFGTTGSFLPFLCRTR